VDCSDGLLQITDTGVGLTEEQVHQLLATIGRSGKRDELGFARHEFLGQFGIGLLSCFVVADEIQVITWAGGDAPTVHWTGFADGRYTVRLGESRGEQGTTVTLIPRRGEESWLAEARVRELAKLFGSLLPVRVEVGAHPVTTDEVPWRAGREAAIEYCRETFGFTPYDIIDLEVPEAGLTGMAFVLAAPASPAARAGHRVYLKRMLLAEGAEGLLPEWAFFARCVVDASELRPTASREALYEDALLESTRLALGDQLRGWLVNLARVAPDRLTSFLSIHHLGVKALALHDDDMLRLVDEWWPMETNVGRLTLREFRQRHGVLRYCATLDEFRQLAGVAAAQQLPVINGGYTYDAQLIERLSTVERTVLVDRLDPSDLSTRFHQLKLADELAIRPFATAAQRAMDRLGCEVVIRSYDPVTLPALYLVDRDASFGQQLRETRELVDEAWAGVLAAFEQSAAQARPQLVLNYRNALVRRISTVGDPRLIELAVEALYAQSLLLGHHPLRPADTALLNRSFLGLLDHAFHDDGATSGIGAAGGVPEGEAGTGGGTDDGKKA
jgi:molecular chaperone HtpG